MHLAHTRSLFLLAFLVCASIMGAAVYLERVAGSAPCPLCDVQRALLLACAGICLTAALHTPARLGWRIYSGALVVVALIGAATAGRQVWLQASPPENLAVCLDNLQYLLDTKPYVNVLALILAGSAGCSEITWSLFGISIPEWSLLAFSGMTLFALYFFFVELRRCNSTDMRLPD